MIINDRISTVISNLFVKYLIGAQDEEVSDG